MYSLIIPPELVSELYYIREETGVSIRRQILDSIRFHIKKSRGDKHEKVFAKAANNR